MTTIGWGIEGGLDALWAARGWLSGLSSRDIWGWISVFMMVGGTIGFFWPEKPKRAKPIYPDMTVTDAAAYVARYLFGDDEMGEGHRQRVNLEILDKAMHHGLGIWCRQDVRPLERLSPMALSICRLSYEEDLIAHELSDYRSRTVVYQDIQLNRRQVQRCWPIRRRWWI